MVWWIPAALTLVGTYMQVQGQQQQGEAARLAGRNQRVADVFEAAQIDQHAEHVVAVSQRQALEERRQARLMQSRALALAAASGAGASDSTVVRIMSDIAGEGAHRAQLALYGGKEEARKLRLSAQAKRYGGALAEQAGLDAESAANTAAIATAFSGAASASLQARYGAKKPAGGKKAVYA